MTSWLGQALRKFKSIRILGAVGFVVKGTTVAHASKIYRQLASDPSQIISFRDFERLLRALGFRHVRTTGSHRQYVHPDVPRSFPVQPQGKDAKRYQVREFLELVENYGLHIEQ